MRIFCLMISIALAACTGDREEQPSVGDTEYTAIPELRIGSLDDPELAFTWFRELEVGPDGSIYTLHPQDHTIRVHDASGTLVRTIGRQGKGPGEFENAGRMGILGDTLWVLDYSNYRFTFFDLGGTLLGSRRIPIEVGRTPQESPPRPERLFSDGSIGGSSPAWSRLVARGEIRSAAILRMDTTGAVEDTIVTYSLENTIWAVTNPDDPRGFGSYRNQPFTDTEIVRISDHAPLVVRVNRRIPHDATRASYEVAAWTLDGDTLFARSFRYTPIPLDPALVDSVVDGYAASFRDRNFAGAPTPEQARVWARGSLYVPDYLPPVSDLVIGQDGSVWLRGESLPDSTIEWRVLSPDGTPVGLIDLPRRLLVLSATQNHVWGTESDELGVPHIVRYRIIPNDAGA